ncbi:MAG TPA: heavy metal-binding domain-containing protein [Bryobacteraceae bacterium]|nr:heavy metal-binding domain-containing protein [Bryobacteraceae bacterium]
MALLATCAFGQDKNAPPDKDWVCPMDPDYRSDKPGFCPKCGMKLVLGIPDRVEYPLEISHAPDVLRPGETARLTLRAYRPGTQQIVTQFEIVHEKLIHLFIVSENLSYFAHVHPVAQPDGSFTLDVKLPYGGMYRLLADFYPAGAVPQLAVGTLFVAGESTKPQLAPALAPSKSENTTASLRMDPEQPLAGLETKLFFSLDPAEGLQPYLGAWAHMLAASEDLIDLLHLHPFLADGRASLQFNVIFPRDGLYRVWTQIQRQNVVNTFVFTIPVKAL